MHTETQHRDHKQVAKLPKWAQEHIRNLEMQRDAAIRTLNEFVDSQQESPVWTDDWACTGEAQGPSDKRHYIQSRSITFLVGKVEVSVLLRHDDTLDINAGGSNIYFQPQASNVIRILELKR